MQETVLPYPIEKVFAFFSDASNLEAITPPSLQFRILTPKPIEMKKGATIDYRLRLFGIPFHWRTLIDEWQPTSFFVDSQLKGPYLSWVHTHYFVSVDGGVAMQDRVEYRVPGGILEPLIHRLFVGPQVKQIFAHRSEVLNQLLETFET